MATKLKTYNKKRDFAQTPEPRGREAPASGAGLRYVIQRHSASREHYDFRLEWQGTLLSWAVPKGPSLNPRDKRLAVRVEDHPLDYRDFEGTIPKGQYGGGTVMLWDEGTWEPSISGAHAGDAAAGLAGGSLKLTLHGVRLGGRWALVRMKPRENEKGDNWLLIKEQDDHARPHAGIEGRDTSVRTGRTLEEIAAGAPAKKPDSDARSVTPQLARLAASVPREDGWLYEVKYDGYRILAHVSEGKARLLSRNGNDYTHRFPTVAAALAGWSAGRAMVLDGEMVVADSAGRTDFQALQGYLKHPRGRSPSYIIFDLLVLEGVDLRQLPLLERKQKLEGLMENAPEGLRYSRHVAGDGAAALRAACQRGMEGIMGKRADSAYSGTRNGDWIKVKCDKRQELVIGGFARTEKKADGVSALLLGYYQGGKLIYAGRTGTGITASQGRDLAARFRKMTRKTCPFTAAPKARPAETVTWLSPKLVAEVKLAEWTDEGLLRQASYKGLREDKSPKEVVRETPGDDLPPPESPPDRAGKGGRLMVEGISISNPSKVLFEHPTVTKADVARYYAAVAGRMLPYVAGRVMSSVRCPKGLGAPCFFRKHPGVDSAGVVPVTVAGNGGDSKTYFYIESAQGLISEVQMGTLEFHPWGSRAAALEQPDIMVFDLDPDAGMALEPIRQGVLDLRGLLAELSLESFLKTSGGKGYHVLVPLKPGTSWEAFGGFAKGIAQVMEQKWPQRYTANVRKARRKGRIFIDWIRNGRGATSVAPYSIRARAGAPVSMPLGWDELMRVEPDGISMADALGRLRRPDPWAGFFKTRQTIK